MQFYDYIDTIRNDSDLMAIAAGKGPEAAAPACPGWTVRDVVAHVGRIHCSKAETVRERNTNNRESDDVPVPSDRDLVDWFLEGATMLADALAVTDPATAVWTWDDNDHTAGFWYRRMAHKKLMHRVDSEQAHGPESSSNQQLCADGIDELLTKLISGPPEWGHVEYGVGTIELRTIGRNWFICRDTYSGTTPSGKIIEEDWIYNPADPVSEPDTIVIGNAQAVNLWLWGRGSAANLAITGDTSAADQLRSDTVEATG